MLTEWRDLFSQVLSTCWADRSTLAGPDLEMCKSYVQVFSAAVQAGGAIMAAVIIGLLGGLITLMYNLYRAWMDRESQWRSHAIELAKLDLQRKLQSRTAVTNEPIRPSMHDFLTNYRQLTSLGRKSVERVYDDIVTKHTDTNPPLYYNPAIMSCAVEIAKLDSARDEKTREADGAMISRPNILNVLANYHELEQLVKQSPETLWHVILADRYKERAGKRATQAARADAVAVPAKPAVPPATPPPASPAKPPATP